MDLCTPHCAGELEGAARTSGLSDAHRVEEGETGLVVQDEAIVRSFILEVLADFGYRAINAVNGLSGLWILELKQ